MMKTKYWVDICGNDTFFVTVIIRASNIELALAEALKQMDSFAKQTIEQLRITRIDTRK